MPRIRLPEYVLLTAAFDVELAQKSIQRHWLKEGVLDQFQRYVVQLQLDELKAMEKKLRDMSAMFWGRRPLTQEERDARHSEA